jgi:hypothetical protein
MPTTPRRGHASACVRACVLRKQRTAATCMRATTTRQARPPVCSTTARPTPWATTPHVKGTSEGPGAPPAAPPSHTHIHTRHNRMNGWGPQERSLLLAGARHGGRYTHEVHTYKHPRHLSTQLAHGTGAPNLHLVLLLLLLLLLLNNHPCLVAPQQRLRQARRRTAASMHRETLTPARQRPHLRLTQPRPTIPPSVTGTPRASPGCAHCRVPCVFFPHTAGRRSHSRPTAGQAGTRASKRTHRGGAARGSNGRRSAAPTQHNKAAARRRTRLQRTQGAR